jgi:hypothetical protein
MALVIKEKKPVSIIEQLKDFTFCECYYCCSVHKMYYCYGYYTCEECYREIPYSERLKDNSNFLVDMFALKEFISRSQTPRKLIKMFTVKILQEPDITEEDVDRIYSMILNEIYDRRKGKMDKFAIIAKDS